MATTDRIYRLTVDANQAVRELQKLNTSVAGIDKKFSAVGVGFKAFATAAAAAFGGGQIISGLKSAANAMDDMGKAAQKIGVSLSALQDLKHMADLSGVSFETLQTSVGRLAQAMSGFEGAGKKSADALRALGVSAKGGTTEALASIADRFQKMPDGVQKTALAMELFGKAGKDMIPFLNQGGEAVKKMAEEADRLGLKFSEVASEQAERFNDALTKIGAISQGITRQFMTGLLPSLTAIAEAFVDNYEKGKLFESIGRGLGAMLQYVAKGAIFVVGHLRGLIDTFSDLIAASGQALQGNLSLAGTILSTGKGVRAVQDDISKAWGDLDARYAKNISQTTALNARTGSLQVTLTDTAAAAKAAADETKRFNAELDRARFDLAKVNAELIGGEGWNQFQEWAQQGAYGLRQMFSPEREQQIGATLEKLVRAREVLDALRAAEAQASADDAKVAAARRAAADAAGEQARAYEAMVLAIKKAVDPTIDLAEQYDNLEQAFEKGSITLAQYTARYKQLEEASKKALGAIEPEVQKVISVSSILEENFQSFFDNMQRGVAGAKDAFKRMAESILIQLARLAAHKLFEQFFGAGTSWNMKNPINIGGVAGGWGSRSFISDQSGAIPSTALSRSAPAGPSLGVAESSPVSVNVINNAGAAVEVEQRQNNDGSLNIDILVERKVRGMIANGSMDRVMGATFGARRRGFA